MGLKVPCLDFLLLDGTRDPTCGEFFCMPGMCYHVIICAWSLAPVVDLFLPHFKFLIAFQIKVYSVFLIWFILFLSCVRYKYQYCENSASIYFFKSSFKAFSFTFMMISSCKPRVRFVSCIERIEDLPVAYWTVLASLSEINWPYIWESIYGRSALFYWSVCWSFCWHYLE